MIVREVSVSYGHEQGDVFLVLPFQQFVELLGSRLRMGWDAGGNLLDLPGGLLGRFFLGGAGVGQG